MMLFMKESIPFQIWRQLNLDCTASENGRVKIPQVVHVYQMRKTVTVFNHISKHQEESWKYDG